MQRVGINKCNKLVEFTMESTKAISDERHEPGLSMSVQGVLTILVDFFAGSDLDSGAGDLVAVGRGHGVDT